MTTRIPRARPRGPLSTLAVPPGCAPLARGLLAPTDVPLVTRGAFTPLALAPFFWIRGDAADVAPLNAGNIATWADKSGNGRTLTEATNQAPYTASFAAFGGRGGMASGVAANKGVQAAAAAPWTFMHNGTGVTLFLVCTSRGPDGSWVVGTGHSAGVIFSGLSVLKWSTSTARVIVGNGAAAIIDCVTSNNTFSAATGHVVIVTYRSGVDPDCVVDIDGTTVGTASETGVPDAGNPIGPFSVGYSSSKGGGADSDILECALLNRVVTAGEKAQLRAYALARYGV
jgi:hypothetical protein